MTFYEPTIIERGCRQKSILVHQVHRNSYWQIPSLDFRKFYFIKTQISTIVNTTNFLNNLHQVRAKPTRDWNNLHQVRSKSTRDWNNLHQVRSKSTRDQNNLHQVRSKSTRDWNNLHQVRSKSTRDWNNLHQVRSKSKYWKAK